MSRPSLLSNLLTAATAGPTSTSRYWQYYCELVLPLTCSAPLRLSSSVEQNSFLARNV